MKNLCLDKIQNVITCIKKMVKTVILCNVLGTGNTGSDSSICRSYSLPSTPMESPVDPPLVSSDLRHACESQGDGPLGPAEACCLVCQQMPKEKTPPALGLIRNCCGESSANYLPREIPLCGTTTNT